MRSFSWLVVVLPQRTAFRKVRPRSLCVAWAAERLIVEALGGASLAENSDGLPGCTWAFFLVGARFSRIRLSAAADLTRPRFSPRLWRAALFSFPNSFSVVFYIALLSPLFHPPPSPPSFHFCSLPSPPSLSIPSSPPCAPASDKESPHLCLEKRQKIRERPATSCLLISAISRYDPDRIVSCRLLMSYITISNWISLTLSLHDISSPPLPSSSQLISSLLPLSLSFLSFAKP